MTGWIDLSAELDAWQAAGRAATLWWRDDDATEPSAALDRLLGLAGSYGVAPAVAVIPARATAALAERLRGHEGSAVWQHGYAHANHAPPGATKAEIGPHRPVGVMLGELALGRLMLDRLFGARWPKVIVPPYNRIAATLAASLTLAGYVGLSTYGARAMKCQGLIQVNSHIDIMEWTTTRAFLGEGPCLALAVGHLRARRAGTVDADEPTGLLTHHLAHDEAAWAFVDRFIERTRAHPAARWLPASALFPPSPAS